MFWTNLFKSGKPEYESVLNRANNVLVKGNDKQRYDFVKELLDSSYGGGDITFIGFYITPMLASQDMMCRKIGFRAVSLLLGPSSPAVSMLPSVLRRSFQFPELVSSSLQALTYVMNKFVFQALKKDIVEIATNSNDLPRILALHCVYLAFKCDPSNLKHLIPLLKRAIVHPALRVTASSIIRELCEESPDIIGQFRNILLSELPLSSRHMYIKILGIFLKVLPHDESVVDTLEKAIAQYLLRNKDYCSLFETSKVIPFLSPNSTLTKQLGNVFEQLLTSNDDPNIKGFTLRSIGNLYPRFIVDTVLLTGLLQSNDVFVKAEATKLKHIMNKDRRMGLNDLIDIISQTKDSHYYEFTFPLINFKGLEYAELLIKLLMTKNPLVIKKIGEVLEKLDDQETQHGFIDLYIENFPELPDTDFGIIAADIISKWSDNADVIAYLLPYSISQKSCELQSHLISCSIEFYLRIRFPIPKTIIYRLELLTQSQYHDVRQRSGEFLDIIQIYP